jgi:antitoxin YefM
MPSPYVFTYNDGMKAMSYSEVRANFARELDRVCDDHDPLIITRQGKPAAVLVSLEDYESMDETAYLASSPANKRALTEAIHDLELGRNLVRLAGEDIPG